MLLTKEEFENVPIGTTLMCIDGKEAVKGIDYIDMDTRFGLIAYGFVAKHRWPFIAMGKVGFKNE